MISVSTSCHKKNAKFSLQGKMDGFSNGSILYLIAAESNDIIDSVLIENNSFYLAPEIAKYPLKVILKSNDNSLYKSFWIENSPMVFKARANTFEKAVVTGSDSETMYRTLYGTIDTLSKKEGEKFLMDFVKTHADHLLGAVVLSEWYILWKKEKTEPLYQLLSDENKKSAYGEEILRYISLNKNHKIGDLFTDFELTDQYGSKTKLSNIAGKWILLEFWASWCAPCRTDNKKLLSIYNSFNPLGFDIFQVSLDHDRKKWLHAIEQDKLVWTNASDLGGWNNEAAIIYGISLLPSNLLLNSDGIIIAQNLNMKKLEQKLVELTSAINSEGREVNQK